VLCERLVRCVEAGRLKIDPGEASQAYMAACIGVALSILSQPEIYHDAGLSGRVRDAVIGDLIVDAAAPPTKKQTPAVKPIALQLAALIRRTRTPLTTAEAALMLQWIDAIASANGLPDV
jgi:hypothetical protein